MPPRRCPNWLNSLLHWAEETETPRSFWIWSGISTIASAIQRKVWLPFGMETLYPNLYIMLVAPPGRCRKGAPVGFSKHILTEIDTPVFADSPTKRALTKAMAKIGETQFFLNPYDDNRPKPHCSISLISKELSSFFAVDAKAMIEVLTDLYDSHEEWKYETSGVGADPLYGVCVNCLFATTPSWMAANLPEESIGGGFTSRVIILAGDKKYKWIHLPPAPDPKLYLDLKNDLARIKRLIGEFAWGPGAEKTYEDWYSTVPDMIKQTRDERLHGFLERMHVMILKTAMIYHISYSDDLIITGEDVERCIYLIEDVFKDIPKALAGHGRSRSSIETENMLRSIRQFSPISFGELLRMNYRNTNKLELLEIIASIDAMGRIKLIYPTPPKGETDFMIHWIDVTSKGDMERKKEEKE